MKKKEDLFTTALKGKKIPILTLDGKWYQLFENLSAEPNIRSLEGKLNELLRRQGKINTETKGIRKLKKKLMSEIVPMVDELEKGANSALEKKIEKHKKMIEECNEKMESYQDEMKELPIEIDEVNFQLMIATMEYCYEKMQDNTEEIQRIAKWVAEVRVELKKNLIRKQEKEIRNHNIYSYMHDIFGADVIDMFDMKYNPQEQHPKLPELKKTDDTKQVIKETEENKPKKETEESPK